MREQLRRWTGLLIIGLPIALLMLPTALSAAPTFKPEPGFWGGHAKEVPDFVMRMQVTDSRLRVRNVFSSSGGPLPALVCRTSDGMDVTAFLSKAHWVRMRGRRVVKFRVKGLADIRDPNNQPREEEDFRYVPYTRDYTVRFTSAKRATLRLVVRVPRCGAGQRALTFKRFKPRPVSWRG